eukprot:3209589-Amphidinium_carterae.1
MSVTLEVSQLPVSMLKAAAPANIQDMLVSLEVSERVATGEQLRHVCHSGGVPPPDVPVLGLGDGS